MFAALGAEPRLRIIYHLLRSHPAGMFAGEIQEEVAMQPSAVSHHLERLKHEDLVRVRREGTYLRYTANPDALQELLTFLFSQCCAGTRAVEPESVFQVCRIEPVSKKIRKERK
jgi:DNA-binding transcriptional ArsR family regulator